MADEGKTIMTVAELRDVLALCQGEAKVILQESGGDLICLAEVECDGSWVMLAGGAAIATIEGVG
jgi:hypothetical protein